MDNLLSSYVPNKNTAVLKHFVHSGPCSMIWLYMSYHIRYDMYDIEGGYNAGVTKQR